MTALSALVASERRRQPRKINALARTFSPTLTLILRGLAKSAADAVRDGTSFESATEWARANMANQLYRHSLIVAGEFGEIGDEMAQKAFDKPSFIARLSARLRADAKETARLIHDSTVRRIERIASAGRATGTDAAGIAETILEKIGGAPARKRAALIARDETTRIANDAAAVAARDRGAKHKVWVTAFDEAVRPCHADMHGKKVPIDELFHACGDLFRYPKDRTYGPKPSSVINCRCTCVYTSR